MPSVNRTGLNPVRSVIQFMQWPQLHLYQHNELVLSGAETNGWEESELQDLLELPKTPPMEQRS